MKDTFSALHPTINLLYFALVLGYTMFSMHPVSLIISLFCALAYSIYLKGKKAAVFGLKFIVPVFLITAALNPLFNHRGATILAYFPNGNPLTLESIYYGIASGTMFAAAILWFSCFHVVMTSDKFIYLFGKVIPSLSLVLSMTLRFVPRFKVQLKLVADAQRCMGNSAKGRIRGRIKAALDILSIMTTWSLESAVETADSMKSRGYGLPNRTNFSIYRFDRRDAFALTALLTLCAAVIIGQLCGALAHWYFPTVNIVYLPVLSPLVYFTQFLFSIVPIVINVWEDRKWKSITSKI